ncbi:MAG TPA: BMC domain-containing protein [Planctomycetaceae bacterium]|nr:BMC domain-containing protein [Planctomycetaceae bacterium]HIQ22314.1 BMC domain-containing protein [Planctomycetota bacterium]
MGKAKAVGAIELSSIGIGYQIEDDMLKAASVDLLIARTICSGKYLVVIGGSVSDVEAAIRAGLEGAGEAIIDHLVVANVHESVFPALGQSVTLPSDHVGALGVIETFSGVSVLAAADVAAKAARVTLLRIHVAMALGGKGLLLMTGSVADVRAGVQAAAGEAKARGLLVSEVVIPRPSRELFAEYL